MEEKIERYLKHHSLTLTIMIFMTIIILASGEYVLFRKIMTINKMVSEGLIQIKEANQPKPTLYLIKKLK